MLAQHGLFILAEFNSIYPANTLSFSPTRSNKSAGFEDRYLNRKTMVKVANVE